MRSSAGLALEDGPHRKVQRIQVRALCPDIVFEDKWPIIHYSLLFASHGKKKLSGQTLIFFEKM